MGPVWFLFVYFVFVAAASSAAVLALWLISSERAKSPARTATAAALGVSSAWGFCAIGFGYLATPTVFLLSATYFAWLWLLYRLFGHDERDKSLAPIRPVVAALALVELLHLSTLLALSNHMGDSAPAQLIAHFAVIFRLLFCVGALVLVHNLYAGAEQLSRQSLRWPAAAMGAIWLYDLNFYTIAYLLNGLPEMLAQLRGAALLVAVIVLAVGSFRSESELKFRPSRSFAFQSFSLLVIGTYLVVMVVVAQAISYAGNAYAPAMQAGFMLAASAVALAVLPSPKLRRWLRVMISKHLFQHRYDYRTEWLRFTDTIGRAGPQAPPLPQRIVQAVADVTDSPAGLLLTPLDEGGLALAARWQWSAIEVPGVAVCCEGARFFEESQFILDLDDLRAGREQEIPPAAYPAWLLEDERAWAVVPLVHYERLVGLVVLARPPLARQLDWEDFDLLRVVGRQLASYLAEHATQDALGEAQRFDEFNRRIAFVMHDIKNLASQLSLLARNAELHADKPAFRADMLLTLRNSTDKLQGLLDRLGRYGSHSGNAREQVDLAAMVRSVAAQYSTRHEVRAKEHAACYVAANAEALEQALVHLVQNAIEASAPTSPVLLDLRIEGDTAIMEVADTGVGMSAEFIRTHLFKPFHSSKPGGFGIGAFEAREMIRAMGGRLDVESREGQGTRFLVRLPNSGSAAVRRDINDQNAEVA
ncbi:PEP-CTERM system histidine kinase PrsK [Aurantiacibacter xanthus]|uniref:histidine kinase n=1 Tax=Aurantiacibacter xanthus TaxID=1784712 RepID=A0A3A1PBH4_9SPHN|nr:XrtA/PEP-CTERM system histidine kinase PrsK [Aurantiacibacter xanthus]RIV90911.1 PEP-CTERM system histidine kinase PrsK [Aurantiacibacter xanthus]